MGHVSVWNNGYEGAAQRTLSSPISCVGVGVHSGARTSMKLLPAPVNSGITFVRTDQQGTAAIIPALWNHVTDTRLCTVVSNEHKVSVGTVEHLMSALRGCGIDNATIEIDGPEVPIMDGSAAPFVFLIECAGVVEQSAPRRVIRVLKEVTVTEGNKTATLSPSAEMLFSFEIDFASAIIARQTGVVDLTENRFKNEISRARTFGFLHEVEHLRSVGLARGGSLDNAIVINGDTVMNPDGLRYTDEFVRHKILDSIGDLYLAGAPLQANFHGCRAGHAMNNKLLHALFADSTAWTDEPETNALAWSSSKVAAYA